MLLARHFLLKYAELYKRNVSGFSVSARIKLMNHDWPGNVRELENGVQQAVVNVEGNTIQDTDLELESIFPVAKDDSDVNLLAMVVPYVLADNENNVKLTARQLGLTPESISSILTAIADGTVGENSRKEEQINSSLKAGLSKIPTEVENRHGNVGNSDRFNDWHFFTQWFEGRYLESIGEERSQKAPGHRVCLRHILVEAIQEGSNGSNANTVRLLIEAVAQHGTRFALLRPGPAKRFWLLVIRLIYHECDAGPNFLKDKNVVVENIEDVTADKFESFLVGLKKSREQVAIMLNAHLQGVKHL